MAYTPFQYLSVSLHKASEAYALSPMDNKQAFAALATESNLQLLTHTDAEDELDREQQNKIPGTQQALFLFFQAALLHEDQALINQLVEAIPNLELLSSLNRGQLILDCIGRAGELYPENNELATQLVSAYAQIPNAFNRQIHIVRGRPTERDYFPCMPSATTDIYIAGLYEFCDQLSHLCGRVAEKTAQAVEQLCLSVRTLQQIGCIPRSRSSLEIEHEHQNEIAKERERNNLML